MPKPRQERDPARTRKVISFLRDGFADYTAARVLFLKDLPSQGAILSSTAIEKCIKAMLAFRGNESHGHLKTAHWNYVCNFDQTLAQLLDAQFIDLNQRAYSLRYTDALPLDFNLVIASREFLAEMDQTVSSIFSCFSLDQSGNPIESLYAAAVRLKDTRVTDHNYVVLGAEKQSFIYSRPQFVYEVRNDPSRGLFEVTYITNGPPKRPGFARAALVPLDEPRMTYDFAFGRPDGTPARA
jgi:hypothetical protein